MQTQTRNARYRGYRESRTLVSLGKGAASDAEAIRQAQQDNEAAAEDLEAEFTTLLRDLVSEVQHLRAQLAYFLLNKD